MATVRETIRAVLAGAARYEPALDTLTVAPAVEVDAVLTESLHDSLATLWRRGWQPVELHRVVARRGHATHARLLSYAIATYLAGFAPDALDERWRAQVDELRAYVMWEGESYLRAFARDGRLERVEVVDTALTLLAILSELPPIELLGPPPGAAGRARARPGPVHRADARLLDRVRGLLAKAESTEFPAEAETYTAKAQQLVTRYSLDEALLETQAGDQVFALARRIGVDHPYEAEKAALLDAIAGANRCYAVWSPELGFSTVFGFDADLDAVDMLYTSLLVQAHQAMARTEPPGGKAGRARLRAYRQSFLVAFAVRIGERLAAVAEAALTEAVGDTDLLPVLASRDERVRDSMRAAFPHTTRGRGARVDSVEGWDSGRAAADRAGLRGRGA
ncbi:DUF2786 domain-containing protein [Luedemannella helvata]|uniref:DUF2786 domain-containing protein n=1 Tax=Luedemannella helvata TaxID=349315 RepID=A0ABN2JV44_9ACTN